eukprot:gene4508-4761_t
MCGQRQQHQQLGLLDPNGVGTGSHHHHQQGGHGVAAAAGLNLMNNYQQYQQMMSAMPNIHQQHVLRQPQPQPQRLAGIRAPPEHAAAAASAAAGSAGSTLAALPRSQLSSIVTRPAGGSDTSTVSDILLHAGTPGSTVTPRAFGQVGAGVVTPRSQQGQGQFNMYTQQQQQPGSITLADPLLSLAVAPDSASTHAALPRSRQHYGLSASAIRPAAAAAAAARPQLVTSLDDLGPIAPLAGKAHAAAGPGSSSSAAAAATRSSQGTLISNAYAPAPKQGSGMDPAAGPMCNQCASSSSRKNHHIVQVRRSTYHEVLKMSEAQQLLDVTDVQPYVINAAKVLFLRPRPQPRPPKGVVMPSRCKYEHEHPEDFARHVATVKHLETYTPRPGSRAALAGSSYAARQGFTAADDESYSHDEDEDDMMLDDGVESAEGYGSPAAATKAAAALRKGFAAGSGFMPMKSSRSNQGSPLNPADMLMNREGSGESGFGLEVDDDDGGDGSDGMAALAAAAAAASDEAEGVGGPDYTAAAGGSGLVRPNGAAAAEHPGLEGLGLRYNSGDLPDYGPIGESLERFRETQGITGSWGQGFVMAPGLSGQGLGGSVLNLNPAGTFVSSEGLGREDLLPQGLAMPGGGFRCREEKEPAAAGGRDQELLLLLLAPAEDLGYQQTVVAEVTVILTIASAALAATGASRPPSVLAWGDDQGVLTKG